MRIVQLVPAMEQGGVERGIVEMNRALIGAGHVNVVVSAGGRLTERLAADGARLVTLDVKSKNPLTFFARAAALRRALAEIRPDVVVAHSRVPAWLFVWANRTLHLPWITFAHGANSISRYSRIMTAGDLTVTPSRYIADYLKAAYGISEKKLRVIPRAIDRDRFDPARLDGAFLAEKRAAWRLDGRRVVMGLGRITQLKGYDTLIRATALLRQRVPNVLTVIVGEAEALRRDVEENLRALVRELALDDAVVFAGNQQKVAECLSLADVVVSANTRKPEAFGRSMAEALAMNRPVVATAFGGALDIVEDGVSGVRVPMDRATAEGFAEAIERALARRWGDLRTPALEKFSFERMVDRSLAVYGEFA
jgi:glycosyltransferase involved in cell wall biosynthesis